MHTASSSSLRISRALAQPIVKPRPHLARPLLSSRSSTEAEQRLLHTATSLVEERRQREDLQRVSKQQGFCFLAALKPLPRLSVCAARHDADKHAAGKQGGAGDLTKVRRVTVNPPKAKSPFTAPSRPPSLSAHRSPLLYCASHSPARSSRTAAPRWTRLCSRPTSSRAWRCPCSRTAATGRATGLTSSSARATWVSQRTRTPLPTLRTSGTCECLHIRCRSCHSCVQNSSCSAFGRPGSCRQAELGFRPHVIRKLGGLMPAHMCPLQVRDRHQDGQGGPGRYLLPLLL